MRRDGPVRTVDAQCEKELGSEGDVRQFSLYWRCIDCGFQWRHGRGSTIAAAPLPVGKVSECVVVEVNTEYTSGMWFRAYCRLKDVATGEIIKDVPCVGVDLAPGDSVELTLRKKTA